MRNILIAGIGNVICDDDGFGSEVIRELSRRTFSDAVTVTDFGMRSHDLVYALTDHYGVIILVDAIPRDASPGMVYLIEPDLSNLSELNVTAGDTHSIDPVAVLKMAQLIGAIGGKLFLVGCEPAILENDVICLSGPIRAAIPRAVKLIESLVAEILVENEKEIEAILN